MLKHNDGAISRDVLVLALVLDALVALGYLGYSAVLVTLACTSLSGWKAIVALSVGVALFLRSLLHGGLFNTASSVVNTGTDKGKA